VLGLFVSQVVHALQQTLEITLQEWVGRQIQTVEGAVERLFALPLCQKSVDEERIVNSDRYFLKNVVVCEP